MTAVYLEHIRLIAQVFDRGGNIRLVGSRPRLTATSSLDEALIQRVAEIFRGRVGVTWVERQTLRVPIYRAQAYGSFAAGWLMTIYPLVGAARQAEIAALLERWRVRPYDEGNRYKVGLHAHPTKPRSQADCHPERRHYKGGLCARCYRRERHRRVMEGYHQWQAHLAATGDGATGVAR